MEQEEMERASAHYNAYADREIVQSNNERQSIVSIRSLQRKRSFVQENKRDSWKAAVLVAAIGVAVLITSVPALFHIFFRTTPISNITNASSGGDVTCGSIEVASDHRRSRCSAMFYTSGVCYDQLAEWQGCFAGQNNSVAINSSSNIGQLMYDAQGVITALSNSGSLECAQAAIPFFCIYVFPLCDSGKLYLPTSQECFNLSMGVCALVWSEVQASPLSYLLPNCSQLPGPAPNGTVYNSTNVTCAEEFFLNGSACFPSCQKWSQYSDLSTLVQNVVLGMSVTFGLATGMLVLIGSCVRRNVMCQFPHFFLILMSISYSIMAVEVVMSLADRGLYCTSDNLYDAFINSSLFCTISGASFHYFLPNMSLFWLFHICSMCLKLFLPHWSSYHPRLLKSINLSFCLLALILPVPAVVVTVVHYQYTVFGFPPILCYPSDIDLYYDSCILVVNILLVIGVALYILLFWKLHKLHGDMASSTHIPWQRWTVYFARHKIMITIGYYIVLASFVLIVFEITLQDFPPLMQTITAYFICQQDGLPNSCSRDTYDKYTHYYLDTTTFIFLSLVTFFHLLYVVNWRWVTKRVCLRRHHGELLMLSDEQNSSSFTPSTMDIHGSSFTSTM